MYTREYGGLGRYGLGDLLTEPNLPLTPENLALQYSRDPYNQAVTTLNALVDQREAIVQANQQTMGTAAIQALPEYVALSAKIDAAVQVVRAYEARMAAIDAARAALASQITSLETNPEYQFWSSKGATSAQDYLTKFGYPGNPLGFFGVPFMPGRPGVVVLSPANAPILPREGSSPAPAWYALRAPSDQRAAWDFGYAIYRGEIPSGGVWVPTDLSGSGYTTTPPGTAALMLDEWSRAYAPAPTLTEYAAAVSQVQAAGLPVTQQTITQQYTETLKTLSPEEVARRAALPTATTPAVTTPTVYPIQRPVVVGGINQLQPPSSSMPTGGDSYSGGGGGGGGGGMIPGGGQIGEETVPATAGLGTGLTGLLVVGAVVGILIASGRARKRGY